MSDSDPPLYVTFRIADRAALRKIIQQYGSMGPDVETITIVDPENEYSEPLSIEVGNLTKKQWEALRVAHEKGHYTSPRGGHLEEIAEELGISKSAVSQRLRAAESKIIPAILGASNKGR
ncbi:helix-turn-helix domain-containing protein [Halodesulfurarchaeum sp. HSR-GB]|uniref:helix-turn-helix domain-containing protein n=1 Tax=Halodesulfurarchaeum sp. HSR-GB TaxID=3074077 RepID=UPI0028561777|nr:helix-turn-helix domain-containing protein [Halodesulfurarchaeum sp. HSR-GB]MDR5656677.1 helix-turn-helix domain-containing protein [Halodesulfurarchaeum sp. HSR-GB]